MKDQSSGTESTGETPSQQKISVGLSPLGGIGVNVVSATGEEAGAILSVEEVEQLASRLQSLSSILLHMSYMQMAQEQMQNTKMAEKLGVSGNKKVWTPGG